MIIIEARSPDPIQERLRQSKREWNKEVKEFIDDLINFKRMMNGQPSKFFGEKGNIKDPIPGDPATIIGVLAGDFQNIVQKGNAIIRQQLEYSKNRRKKQLVPGIPSSGHTNLSQQLASRVEEYELLTLASSPLSRFFTRLLNPSFGDSQKARINKYRISLLNSIVELYRDMSKLQAAIVGSNPESIFYSSRLLTKISNNWDFFKTGIKTFKESDKKQQFIKNIKPSPTIDDQLVNNILDDYQKNIIKFKSSVNSDKFKDLIDKYMMVPEQEKANLVQSIILEYNNLLTSLNEKFKLKELSLNDLWNKISQSDNKLNVAQYSSELTAIGEKTLQKWIGKVKHKLHPFDKTSAHRLDIFNYSEEIREILDEIMNSLEKEMNSDKLMILSLQIDEIFKEIKNIMSGLDNMIKEKDFDNTFLSLLDNSQITNFDPNLSISQRDHLKKLIEKRRLRGLTDFYQGQKNKL